MVDKTNYFHFLDTMIHTHTTRIINRYFIRESKLTVMAISKTVSLRFCRLGLGIYHFQIQNQDFFVLIQGT